MEEMTTKFFAALCGWAAQGHEPENERLEQKETEITELKRELSELKEVVGTINRKSQEGTK